MIACVSLRLIAGCAVKYDAYSVQVVYLFKCNAFCVHLVPDGIRSLDPFLDLESDSGSLERFTYGSNELIDFLITIMNVPVDVGCYAVEGVRLFITQPDVLHFGFYSIETEPVGEWYENKHRLA